MLPKRAYGIYSEKGESEAEKKGASTGADFWGDFTGVNEDEGFLYYNRACFYVGVNKLDLALEDVLKAIELNDFFEDYMKEDEELNDIRTLEKYKNIFE